MSKNEEKIKVAVRCRPLTTKEKNEFNQKCVTIDNERGEIIVQLPGHQLRNFFYDRVYDENSTQDTVFAETAMPIIESVCGGYNGTIFAYGQTGTGKTYTMEGDFYTDTNKGIIPRSFDLLFSLIKGTYKTNYLIRCSYLELYNEEVRDLLAKNHTQKLDIREDPESGFYVEDLSTWVVKAPSDMADLLLRGRELKVVKGHNMNERSSRSHCIFAIIVENSIKDDSGNDHIRKGKLNLVDLAGSERTSKIKEEGGATGIQKETIHINLSLTALGKVICALVSEKRGHIPYRDSKLTKLLMDSLGGNSKTVMIANIGPADYNYEETVTTLRYADRAKNIKNKPRENIDPKDAMILQYQEELNKLRQALSDANGGEIIDYSSLNDNTITPDSRKKIAEFEEKLNLEKEKIVLSIEEEKKKIEESNKLVEAEKYELLDKLKKKQEEQNQRNKDKEKLIEKINNFERQFIIGEENEKKAKANEEILKSAKEELEIREVKRLKLQKEYQENEEKILELQTKFKDQDSEISGKSKAFEKFQQNLKKAEIEVEELKRDHEANANEFHAQRIQIKKERKYKKLIINSFIPEKYLEKLQEIVKYDANNDVFFFERFEEFLDNGEEKRKNKKGKKQIGYYEDEEEMYDYAKMNEEMQLREAMESSYQSRSVYLTYDNIGKTKNKKKIN